MYKNETMILAIEMWSSTFSVHEKIDVWVSLFPDYNLRNSDQFRNDPAFQSIDWDNLNFTVSFEGSYCTDMHNRIVLCRFVLTNSGDNLDSWHSGQEEMRYSVGGSHDIMLYEEIFTSAEYQQGNFSRVERGFIDITSINAINNLRQAEEAFNASKYVIVIALITTLVGLLALYQRVRETLLKRFGEYHL